MQALEECVRELDPGSRALLDLSLRRRLPLEAMAAVLRTDPFDLARRRARSVARIAADLDLDGPGVIACVRAALAKLSDEAWMVPRPVRQPVQAEEMAAQARALMDRLRDRKSAASGPPRAVDDHQAPPPVPSPTSPFSTGFARIADEEDDATAPLPPLAQALRRAAAAERVATLKSLGVYAAADQEAEPVAEPETVEGSAETIEFVAVAPLAPEPSPAPAAALVVVHRPSAKKIARGGILVALIAALLRFLLRR
jgi:hypothetical protein